MTRLPTTTLWLLAACAPVPWPEDDPAALGPHAVGHATITVVDAAREDRTLVTEAWYPADPTAPGEPTTYELAPGIGLPSEAATEEPPVAAGRHGLVVFSHGYQAIATQSVELCEAMASHGYVVLAPTHAGNAQGDAGDAFEVAAAQRVPDVTVLLDAALAGAVGSLTLDGHVDDARIAVVGHSFGGMTALGAAGGWAGADPDPRVRAIVPISAVVDADLQADDRSHPYAGFSDEQLQGITVPTLLVGGSLDVDVPPANNDLAFDAMGGAEAVYAVEIAGATHTSFANVCQIGALLLDLGIAQEAWSVLGAGDLLEPYRASCGEEALDVEEVHRLLETYTVAFLRHHLDGAEAYGRYLEAGFADAEPDVSLRRRVR